MSQIGVYIFHPFNNRSGKQFFLTIAAFVILLMPFKNYGLHSGIPARIYNSSNGFAPSTVRTIIQDKVGFIWCGTDEGLIRFDGYKFSDANSYAADSTGALFKDTRAIIEDVTEKLWLGTTNGLFVLDKEKGSVTEIKNNIYSLGYVSSLCIIDDKQLWAGTADGIFIVDIYTRKVTKFSYNINSNNYVIKYNKDQIVTITYDILSLVDVRTSKILFSFPYAENKSYEDILIKGTVDGHGYIWAGKHSGMIYSIDIFQRKITPYDMKGLLNVKSGITNDFHLKSKDTLLFAIDEAGLFFFDRNKNKFTPYITKETTTPQLSNNKFQAILYDHQESLWIGMDNIGIVQIHEGINRFEHLSPADSLKHHLFYPQISSLMEDSHKKLWVGTDGGGLYYWNAALNRFSICESNTLFLKNEPFLSLYEDSKNRIWAGTFREGLILITADGKIIKQYKHDSNDTTTIPCNDVRKIAEDKEGNLWLAVQGMRICKFNPQTEKFTQYSNFKGILGAWTMDMIVDDEGMLWVGTTEGVSRQINNKFDFIQYTSGMNDSALSHHFVNCLFKDSKKRIWVGTEGGLDLFLKKENKFLHFTKKDGFKNTHIKSITEDKNGMIWGGTNFGAFCINPETRLVLWFSYLDGMQESKFMDRSCITESNGKIALGTSNGIIYVDPNHKIYSNINCNAFITTVKSYDKILYPHNATTYNEKDSLLELEVDYLTNNLTFEFTIFDYLQPQKNMFSYKLIGIDNNFSTPSFEKKATYSSLPSGEYIFEVKALGVNDTWTNKTAKIKIIIDAPWWQTKWFKMFYTLTTLLILMTFYYLRLRSVKQKNILLDQQVKSRTAELNQANSTKDKFFSIIAHDLKGPVKGLTTLTAMLKQETQNIPHFAQKELVLHIDNSSHKIQNLILGLFEWAKTQTIGVKPDFAALPLKNVVMDVIELLSVQALEKRIEIINLIPQDWEVYCDTNMISTVIRNILSNSIKYTPVGKEITISAKKIPGNKVMVSISDNGIGMNEKTLTTLFSLDKGPSVKGTANETGTGLGLIIAKEFVTLNKGEISAESTLGKGATFNITLIEKKQDHHT